MAMLNNQRVYIYIYSIYISYLMVKPFFRSASSRFQSSRVLEAAEGGMGGAGGMWWWLWWPVPMAEFVMENKKREKAMGLIGFIWIYMDLYGFIWVWFICFLFGNSGIFWNWFTISLSGIWCGHVDWTWIYVVFLCELVWFLSPQLWIW